MIGEIILLILFALACVMSIVIEKYSKEKIFNIMFTFISYLWGACFVLKLADIVMAASVN